MISPRQAMTPSMNTQRVYTWEGICWGAVIVNFSSVLLTSVDIKGKPIWHNRGNGIVDFDSYETLRSRVQFLPSEYIEFFICY